MDEIKYVNNDDMPTSNLMQWLPMIMFVALISCCLALAIFANIPVIVSPPTETPVTETPVFVSPIKEPTSVVTPTPSPETTPPTPRPSSTPNPTLTPTTTSSPVPTPTTTPAAINLPTIHLIVPGDNLWNLAEAYYNEGLRYILICEVNDLTHNCDLIHPGNSLTIPK